MIFVEVNYLAVLGAAIANMILGALWYSPVLFAKPWLKEVGKTEADLKKGGATKMYGYTFIGALVMAYILAHFVQLAGATTWLAGAQAGFWAALGFVAPTFAAEYMFAGKSLRLYGITVGYHAVALIVIGALLAWWG